MQNLEVSIDEFMSSRKAVRGGSMFKASKAPASWNAEQRSARFVMSAQVKDRDGDIVMIRGINLEEFLKNPVCLLNHKMNDLIGDWANVLKRDALMDGDAVLGPAGATPEIDKTAGLLSSGLLRGSSIGFIPKTVRRLMNEDGSPSHGYEITECELVECSIVTIPANPMALAKGASETSLAFHLIEEVLDTYVKDPATGLIVPKAEYEAAHKLMTGNKTTIVMPEDGLFTRIGKHFGLIPVSEKAVEPEPEIKTVEPEVPVKDSPRLATAEEKQTAQARAEAVMKRAQPNMAHGA